MKITKDDIGRRVWDLTRGFGTISDYDDKENNLDSVYIVTVRYDTHGELSYSTTGKYLPFLNPQLFWDELKFEEPPKPKRKIKRQTELWGNVYLHPQAYTITYSSREEADKYACKSNRVACVRLTGEYEVEE